MVHPRADNSAVRPSLSGVSGSGIDSLQEASPQRRGEARRSVCHIDNHTRGDDERERMNELGAFCLGIGEHLGQLPSISSDQLRIQSRQVG